MNRRQGLGMTAAAVLIAATAGCGGGGSSSTASAATTLGVKSTTITLAPPAGTPAPGTDGQTLTQGDTLTTNGTGFGIVNYPDKSLTRLDKNAVFTLDSIGTSATQPQVKATLKKGQAWNRVQKITGSDGQFQITTPYGTVAVRGTTFNIDCTTPANTCTVTAIEGTVQLTPTTGSPVTLTAPTQGILTATGATGPNPIPATFTTSAWATTNTTLDAALPAKTTAASPAGANNAVAAKSTPLVPASMDLCKYTSKADLAALGLTPFSPETFTAKPGQKDGPGPPETQYKCYRIGNDLKFSSPTSVTTTGTTVFISKGAPEQTNAQVKASLGSACTEFSGPTIGDSTLWLTCKDSDGRPVFSGTARSIMRGHAVAVTATAPASGSVQSAFQEIATRVLTEIAQS